MGGSGSVQGLSRILVYEFVTGGGLAGRELPPSWVAEGSAIRRAISADFAALGGFEVVAMVDARLPREMPPGVVASVVGDGPDHPFPAIAARSDYTVLIAPETDGLLDEATRAVDRLGARRIGSDPDAIGLVADKARLADHFEALGITHPPTLVFETSSGLPDEWDGPVIVKPVDGAGSLETFVVTDGRLPVALGSGRRMLMQPYLPGLPMSASFLVDRVGRAWPIAVGRQRIEVDSGGRVRYQGGTIPSPTSIDLDELTRAVDSVPGLRGFVGVDFLDDGEGGALILEINPRPTTSYVGLARLLPPGTIAGAWLAADSGPLEGTGWPDRLAHARSRPPTSFAADGSDRSERLSGKSSIANPRHENSE